MPTIRNLIIVNLLAGFVLLSGCGKKVKTKDLGPDEYFEYAKAKFDNGKYLTSVTEFTIITLRFSGNPIVDDAQYYLAESHFKQKDYLIAISEYQKLMSDYPQSSYYVLAQFKVALSYYNLSLRPELDQDFTKKALRQFQAFIEENPAHELRENAEKLRLKLREKLAKKRILGATTYRKMGINDAAVIYYDIILSEYYDTAHVEEALYWKGECLFQLKKYTEAQNTFIIFAEKYPESGWIGKVKKRISQAEENLNSPSPDGTAELSERDNS